MALKCEPTVIPEVLCITPDVHGDARGFFMETFHEQKYERLGIRRTFVQDNYSHSSRPTLRGLHYQLRHPQAKLVSVIWGRIYDVAVDIRVGSPTYGRWVCQELSDANRCQLYIPEGFAHGFCVLSDTADVMYKCTDFYAPGDDRGILWSDPQIGVAWPIAEPVLSAKDRALRPLATIPREELPAWRAAAARTDRT